MTSRLTLRPALSALLAVCLWAGVAAQPASADARTVATVTIPGLATMAVAQQLDGKPGFVSTAARTVTQFGLAARYGVTGLLAHNDLAGKAFFNLVVGQEIKVGYSDGGVQTYRIIGVYRFQALDPLSPRSLFVDLDGGRTITSAELFAQMYTGGDRVVFQTCIKRDGNLSWGRLFVVTERVN